MRVLSYKDIIGFSLVFSPFALIAFIPSVPAGLFVGVYISVILGWIVVIGLPIYVLYLIVNFQMKRTKMIWETSMEKLKESLAIIDYYNYGVGGAIGIDILNNKLAIIDASNPKSIKPPFIIEKSILTGCYYEQSGRTVYYDNGGVSSGIEAGMGNLSETIKQSTKTGLFLQLDDIHKPKLFLRMPYEEAERWGLLISKFLAGNLERPAKFTFYPTIN